MLAVQLSDHRRGSCSIRLAVHSPGSLRVTVTRTLAPTGACRCTSRTQPTRIVVSFMLTRLPVEGLRAK